MNKAKIATIEKLPPTTSVKVIRSILGMASFYMRFIKDFPKISRPLTNLLKKDASFYFNQDCMITFTPLKNKLAQALIMIAPDQNLPFELMYAGSNFAVRGNTRSTEGQLLSSNLLC